MIRLVLGLVLALTVTVTVGATPNPKPLRLEPALPGKQPVVTTDHACNAGPGARGAPDAEGWDSRDQELARLYAQ